MIEKILPATVACVEAFDDPPDATLFAEEEKTIAAAVEKRRREYTTVRACARQALGALGLTPGPILSDEHGAPRWPVGIVGSMTHCDGYRAAAVARVTDVPVVGIDAEPHEPLPAGILEVVALDAELSKIAVLQAAEPTVRWDRLLFSAKESVYKAWFPLTRRWLGFEDADIELRADGTFTAWLLAHVMTDPNGEALNGSIGHWLTSKGLVVTTIARLAR
jgi:4'-phosphopantetheinyl transferase EntD